MGSKCNLVTAMWWGAVPSVIIRNDNKRISTNAEEASWFSYREPSKFLHWALKRKQLPSGEDCYALRRKCLLSRNSHFILLISSTNGIAHLHLSGYNWQLKSGIILSPLPQFKHIPTITLLLKYPVNCGEVITIITINLQLKKDL